MNSTKKKLDALINALGFDVEVVDASFTMVKLGESDTTPYPDKVHRTDYKLTKRKCTNKPTLHKIIREYENEGMTASKMIGRIMLLEDVSYEDL